MNAVVRDHDCVVAHTRAWVDRAVIGLNLCPFAKAPQVKGRIRYVVSDADSSDLLIAALTDELERLIASPSSQIETTLLIHPYVFDDFDAFNGFIGTAEGCVTSLGLDGIVQLATFHPRYRFAGTDVDDIGNATNRAPYPTLHLLRESSVDRAVLSFPDAAQIFDANIATLERLGAPGWSAIERACREDARIDDASSPS